MEDKNIQQTKDIAYSKIRKMIISGILKPGHRFSMNELTEQLGLGRTPVREALLSLAKDELVNIYPRRYIEIAPISSAKVNWIFEFRMFIEPAILKKHHANIDLVKLMELRQAISDNIAVYEANIVSASAQQPPCAGNAIYPDTAIIIDEQFHTTIVNAAANSIINKTYSNFMDYTNLLWTINSRFFAARSHKSDQEHLQIIDSILQNEIDAAAEHLTFHLELSRNAIIQELIQKYNPSQ